MQPNTHKQAEETTILKAEVETDADTGERQNVLEAVPAEDAGRRTIIGIVTDCLKLNVRSEPVEDPTGDNVIATIHALTEVAVDMEASTEKFYKVCTPAGIEGFCMRKYIAVCQQ